MKRIQLSRRKGFQLPPNTVNCARPGPWGNPFIVGVQGDREKCVNMFELLCAGAFCISQGEECHDRQQRFMKHAKKNLSKLCGKDLACWCRLDGKPCHADVLLRIANA